MGHGDHRLRAARARRLAAVPIILLLVASCTAHESQGPELATARWARLPDAPVPGRVGATGAWTGRELLVWGGLAGLSQEDVRADGAAYDPARRRWRVLAPAPLSARSNSVSVWTGTELVVWGGYDHVGQDGLSVAGDGAAYDPTTDAWRRMAPSPPGLIAHTVAVWTGKEAVFVGAAEAAAYDPALDRWRVLPPLPRTQGRVLSRPVALWTDRQLVVWWPWLQAEDTAGGSLLGSGLEAFSYDPTADRWTPLPQSSDAPVTLFAAFWTGSEVVVPAYGFTGSAGPPPHGLTGRRSGAGAEAWRPMPHGPVDDDIGPVVWAGSGLLRLGESGKAAFWDQATDRWYPLADPPLGVESGAVSAWTGHQLLLWGNVYPTSGPRVPQWSGLSLTPSGSNT